MSKTKTEIVGKIHQKGSLTKHLTVGEADGTNGEKYGIACNVADTSPIIMSVKTGKWYTLPWKDIINLAVGAGIDEPGEVPE